MRHLPPAIILAALLLSACEAPAAPQAPQADGLTLWSMNWARDGRDFNPTPSCSRVRFNPIVGTEGAAAERRGSVGYVAVLPMPNGSGTLVKNTVSYGDGTSVSMGYATTEEACLKNYLGFHSAVFGQ